MRALHFILVPCAILLAQTGLHAQWVSTTGRCGDFINSLLRLPSGAYLCRFQAGNYTEIKKLVLLK